MSHQHKPTVSKTSEGAALRKRKRSKRWNFEDVAAVPPPTLIQGVPFSGRQKLFAFKRDDCPQAASQ